MGRPRKVLDGLEPRVYLRSGSYYFVHRDGRWEGLGQDKAAANQRARLYNDPSGRFGSMLYWLDMFLVDCDRRTRLDRAPRGVKLSPRTLQDYREAIGCDARPTPLRKYLGAELTPLDVTPDMVQKFLDVNARADRSRRANMERACLSSCFGWLLRNGLVPGLRVNPCLRSSGVRRNPETARDLYVETAWYQEVYDRATPSVQLLMELTYRTLQRPESDIVKWDTRVLASQGAVRLLKFTQNKTGKRLQVELTAELDAKLRASLGSVTRIDQPLIRNRNGHAYTYDGICAMLRRYIQKANAARKAKGLAEMPSWGFRDLKGKGATDMWLAGVPLEEIQHLCGHEKKTTTEIYVKARWRSTAQPNRVVMT